MAINYHEPPLDPFGDRDPLHYVPTNEAARRTYSWWLITRDLDALLQIYKSLNDDRKRKLILQFIYIKLLVLDKHVRRLVNLATREWHEVKQVREELEKLDAAYNRYLAWWKPRQGAITTVRNDISAHMGDDKGDIDDEKASAAWDALTEVGLDDVFSLQRDLFFLLRQLPTDTWMKRGTEGEVGFVQPFRWDKITFTERPNPDDTSAAPPTPPK